MIIGSNPKSYNMWKGVMEKVKKQLARWKGKCLSFVGGHVFQNRS